MVLKWSHHFFTVWFHSRHNLGHNNPRTTTTAMSMVSSSLCAVLSVFYSLFYTLLLIICCAIVSQSCSLKDGDIKRQRPRTRRREHEWRLKKTIITSTTFSTTHHPKATCLPTYGFVGNFSTRTNSKGSITQSPIIVLNKESEQQSTIEEC